MQGERRMVLWVPDWPLAAHTDNLTVQGPVVSISRGRVVAASLIARRRGITSGMQVSTAAQIIPDLQMVAHDENYQAGAFESVLKVFDNHISGVRTAYPGLAWAPLSATQWAVPEEQVLHDLVNDLGNALGVEAFVGAGSGTVAAVAAARSGQMVPAEHTKQFLAPLPIRALLWGFAPSERAEYQDAYHFLTSLGIKSLSQLWAIGRSQLAGRLGVVGEKLWTLAIGGDVHQMSAPLATSPPVERWEFTQPAAVFDHVIFEIKTLTNRFVDSLTSRGLVVPTISVGIEDTYGNVMERRWAMSGSLTSQSVSTRVVWQLHAWRNQYQQCKDNTNSGTIGEGQLLKAVTLTAPDASTTAISAQLWGEQAQSSQVDRAVIEVQLLAGEESVVQPHLQGGLDPRERVVFLPWGHPVEELMPSSGPWDGSLGDAPIVVFDDPPVARLFGQSVEGMIGPIRLTKRGLLSGTPTMFSVREGHIELPSGSYRIETVLGLWVLRGTWWDQTAPGQARAFLQLSVSDLVGKVLLIWKSGEWMVEGIYSLVPTWSYLRTRGRLG